MKLASLSTLILSLTFSLILLTDLFYNYNFSNLVGKSMIFDFMKNFNVFLIFLLIYIAIALFYSIKEYKYYKTYPRDEVQKLFIISTSLFIPLLIPIVLSFIYSFTKFSLESNSYLVFIISITLFSMAALFTFIDIYFMFSNEDFLKISIQVITKCILIILGIGFFSNFVHLLIFNKIGLTHDCSLFTCFEANDFNIILFLVLAYLIYHILYWFHEDVFSGIFKVIMVSISFILNVVITYFISKWLTVDWAIVFLTLSYTFFIYQMIKMACTKHSEKIIKNESIWKF